MISRRSWLVLLLAVLIIGLLGWQLTRWRSQADTTSQTTASIRLGVAVTADSGINKISDLGTTFVWSTPLEWYSYASQGDSYFNAINQRLATLPNNQNVILNISTGSGWAKVSDNRTSYAARPFSPPNDWPSYSTFVQRASSQLDARVKYFQVLDDVQLSSVWLGSPNDYISLVNQTKSATLAASQPRLILSATLNDKAILLKRVSELYLSGQINQALDLAQKVFGQSASANLLRTQYGNFDTSAALAQLLNPQNTITAPIIANVTAVLLNARGSLDGIIFYDYDYFSDPSLHNLALAESLKVINPPALNALPVFYLTSVGDGQANGLVSDLAQAQSAIIYPTMALANQIENVLWWALADQTNVGNLNQVTGLADSSGTPKKSYLAYQVLAQTLTGKKYLTTEKFNVDGVYLYRFGDSASTVLVGWSQTGNQPVTTTLPSAASQASVIPTYPENSTTRRITQNANQLTLQLTADPLIVSINGATTSQPPTFALKAGWNLLAFPGQLTATAGQSIFGPFFPYVWQWDGTKYFNLAAAKIVPQPGQGFWIHSDFATTLTPSNILSYQPNAAADDLPLGTNWTMLGNPSTSPLDLTQAKIVSGDTIYSYSSAITSGLISPLYLWNVDDQRWSAASSVWPAQTGAFVKNKKGQTLNIRLP